MFLAFFSCYKGKYKLYKETRFLFDSFFEIDLFANDDIKYKEDINTIFDEIENLGNELDFRVPDSLISKQKAEKHLKFLISTLNFLRS